MTHVIRQVAPVVSVFLIVSHKLTTDPKDCSRVRIWNEVELWHSPGALAKNRDSLLIEFQVELTDALAEQ
jgi:hypothetical protein